MKKLIRSVAILLLSVLLSACGGDDFTGLESDPESEGNAPRYGSLREIDIGTSFTYTAPAVFTGSMECVVTDVRLVTEESQCPPEEWFFSTISVINQETGRAKLVDRNEWFTEGGAFDQGVRILVVDVTLKNIDAEGNPPGDGESMFYDDPTVFDMIAIMNMVDTSIVLNDDGDYPNYQSYIEIGFSQLNQFIPDEDIVSLDPYVHWDSNKVQLPKGETISFNLCFPVLQYDDGSQRDLSSLAIIANDSPDQEAIIIPLELEE